MFKKCNKNIFVNIQIIETIVVQGIKIPLGQITWPKGGSTLSSKKKWAVYIG